jgi:hypothetical protein
VTIDPFCNSYVGTDLVSLRYAIFIEPLAILPREALFFDSDHFTNNSTKKVIEWKINASFILLEEYFSTAVTLYNKKYEAQFEDLSYHMKY